MAKTHGLTVFHVEYDGPPHGSGLHYRLDIE